MSSQRQKLDGFLAKFLDPATTDEEAYGAVKELVRRLRALHHTVGDKDLVLMLVSLDEKQKLEAYRVKLGEKPAAVPAEPARGSARGAPVSSRDAAVGAAKIADVLDHFGVFKKIDEWAAGGPKKDDEEL